ncbi:MAG TPA: MarR family transcriptional regulator [Actinophytocola sp.]|uniref:MarR family winged helix-turn-helix transcriptional regulator n=1 Tax=Actinophytocola sp. TaxID=1872138 RepID=UPI002DB7BF82|nr:MarR family transcriptional regulator [Actinophytocola sp.]HEU5469894.1 MarR family transcriptional regulator [Actinophytocola sp.]
MKPTVGSLLWRVTMKWRAAVERAVAPLGLTHAQYTLLASLSGLSARGERPSQRELADFTGLEQVYVSKLARALERSGFIERASHPADPRAVQLALTARGAEVVARAAGTVAALVEELTAPLGGPASGSTVELTTMLRALLGEPRRDEREKIMSEPTQTTVLFGQDLGVANRAGGRLLHRILATENVTFPEWISMKLLHDLGRTAPREAIIAQVSAGLDLDRKSALAVLSGLEDRGVLHEPAAGVTLTDAGRTLFDRLLAAAERGSEEALAGVPAEDVTTARRVLTAYTARVNEILSTSDA